MNVQELNALWDRVAPRLESSITTTSPDIFAQPKSPEPCRLSKMCQAPIGLGWMILMVQLIILEQLC